MEKSKNKNITVINMNNLVASQLKVAFYVFSSRKFGDQLRLVITPKEKVQVYGESND